MESENASSDISVCSDSSFLDGSSILSEVSFGWEEMAAVERLNMDSPDENGSSRRSERRPGEVKLKWGANRFDVADENSSEGIADDDVEISTGENKQVDSSTCLQEIKTDRPKSVAFSNLTKENRKNTESSYSEVPEDIIKEPEKKLKHKVNESRTFHSEDSDQSINDTGLTDGKKVMRIQKNYQTEPHNISLTEDSDTDVSHEETKESNVNTQQNCHRPRIGEPLIRSMSQSENSNDSTYYSAEETRNKRVNKKLEQSCASDNICQTKLQMPALFNSEEYNPITPRTELELGQLTEDDEIWMIQCPITLDPQNLKNKDLVFRGTSDFTFQLTGKEQSYETATFDTKKSVSCLLYSKKDHCLKATVLHPVGLMIIKEKVDVPELETFSLPRQNNLQLPNDLKIRHPLFGIGYATELQLRSELKNYHSMASDINLLTYENRIQKDKRKSTDKCINFSSMKEDMCDTKRKQDNEGKITEEYENNSLNFLQQKKCHKTKNKEKEDAWKDGKTVTSHQIKRKRKIYEPLMTNGSDVLNICPEKMTHKKKKKRMETCVDLMKKVEENSLPIKKKHKKSHYDTSFSEETATSRDELIVKENAKDKCNVYDNGVLISELDVSLGSDVSELKKKKMYKANTPENCVIKPKETVVPENGYRLKKKKANYEKKLKKKKNKQNVFSDDILIFEDLTPDGHEYNLKKKKPVYGKCEKTLKSGDSVPENECKLKKKRSKHSMSDDNLMKSEDVLKTGHDNHKLKKNKYKHMSEGDLLTSKDDLMQGNDKHEVKKKKYKHKKSRENVLECEESEITENGHKFKKNYKHSMCEEGLTPENDDHNLKKNKHKCDAYEDDLVTGNDEFILQKKEHKISMSEDSILKCEDNIIMRNEEHELKKKIHELKLKKKKQRHNLLENSLLKYESDEHTIKKKHKHIMHEGSVSENKESVIWNNEHKVKKIKHKHGLLKCGQDSVQENDEFKLKKKKKHKHNMSNDTILKHEDLIPECASISQINKKRRDIVPSDNMLKFEDIQTETEYNSDRKEKKSGDGILNCEVNVIQKYDKHKVKKKKKKKHKRDVSPH